MITTLRFSAAAALRLGAGLGLLLGSCAPVRDLASSTYDLQTRLNPADPARAAAPHGIEAVCARGTLNYLIPVEGSVVLVDAGYDEEGEAILAALEGRKVLAVLLTHGHLDHRAAAHLFDAPVYVGAGDLLSFTDPRHYHALVPLAGEVALGLPPVPRTLLPVEDGEVLVVGGRRFTALHLPGHTPGSTAWLFEDVLFTGDAVQAPRGEAVFPAPWLVSEDIDGAWRSLRRLERVPFTTLFDGHYGRLDDARPKVRAALDTYRQQGPFTHPLLRPTGCAEGSR